MKKFFAICRESYGLTVKYLGKFESCPNELDDRYVDIIDENELREFKALIENILFSVNKNKTTQ